jgi:outer membrane biosynthesis protein TonB
VAGQTISDKINWTYVTFGLLALAAFFVLAKLVATPVEPAITLEQPVVSETPAATELTAQPNQDDSQDEEKKASTTQKKPKQKAPAETKESGSKPEKSTASHAEKPAEQKTEAGNKNEKSGWETFKDSVKSGTERKCTQAEIALNQCAK